MKKFLLAIVCFFSMFTMASCFNSSQEYTGKGYTVTMEKGMVESQYLGLDTYYVSKKIGFGSYRESKKSVLAVLPTCDLETYGLVWLTIKSINESVEKYSDDAITYYYATYTYKNEDNEFFYYAAFYETDTHYYAMSFWCNSSDREKYEPKFANWAKTVKFE